MSEEPLAIVVGGKTYSIIEFLQLLDDINKGKRPMTDEIVKAVRQNLN